MKMSSTLYTVTLDDRHYDILVETSSKIREETLYQLKLFVPSSLTLGGKVYESESDLFSSVNADYHLLKPPIKTH